MPAAKRRKKSSAAPTPTASTTTPRTRARLRDKAEKAAATSFANINDQGATTSNTSAPAATSIRTAQMARVQSTPPPSPPVESSPPPTPRRSSKTRAHKKGKLESPSPSPAPSVEPTPPPPTPSLLWQNEDCLREVCSYLGQGDLYSLLTVNRAFYLASTPLLYRLLRQPPGCPCHGLPERDVELAEKYTTAIEFFPHSHRRHLPRFKSDRVTTHIVNYDFANRDKETDKHGRTPAWGTYKCPNCPKAPPPPQRIVFRPMYGAADYKFNDKTPKRIFTPSGTKCPNRIVHVSLHMFTSTFASNERMYPAKPVTPTKQLTVVVLPQFWDCGHVVVGGAQSWLLGSLRYALRDLIITSYDHSIRIVGMENADPFASESDWNSRETRNASNQSGLKNLLDGFLGSWRCAAWSAAEKAKVHDKITYQTFRDYLESGDWGAELSWQLVGRWLNALDLREKGLMTTPVLPGTERAKGKADKKTKKKAKRKRRSRKYGSDTESEAEFTSDGEGDWVLRGQAKKKGKVRVKQQEEGVSEVETDEEDY